MKALVLSGGGSRGSWEAGVILYLSQNLDTGFDFVSGTSVGAINAGGIAMFLKKDFKETGPFIVDMWRNHVNKTSAIWQLRQPLGIPALWNESVGTNSQLDVLLTKFMNIDAIVKSDVQVRFVTVDVLSGKVVEYDNASLATHGIKPIMASASFPLAFPAVSIEDRWETDGGVMDIAPLSAAIKSGADDITVLVTRNPYDAGAVEKKDVSWLGSFGMRLIHLMSHDTLNNDVRMCEIYNKLASIGDVMRKYGVADSVVESVMTELKVDKKVIKLTVLYPSKDLGPSLDFGGEMMEAQIQQGIADATAHWEASANV